MKLIANKGRERNMHTVLKGLVEAFAKDFCYPLSDLPKNFEYFINYLIVHQHLNDLSFQPRDVTTQDDDASLDGISILMDNELVTSFEMAEEILIDSRKKVEVKVILTQVKSGEAFDKEEMTNFMSGVINFLQEKPSYPVGDFNDIRHKIFYHVLSNPMKIKNNLPDLEVYYCTSGVYKSQPEQQGVLDLIENYAKEKTFFDKVKVKALDRKEIINLQSSLSQDLKAKLKIENLFAIPSTKNVPQSYLAIVKASEFIDNILLNEEQDDIRNNIFDENIRAYLGEDVDVNSNIKQSLVDEKKREIFSLLNNGITIITPEMAYSASESKIELVNYQVINGCQTSNVLFENRHIINDDAKVIIKFISTTDENTINHIISSTNSQSHINDNAFLALKEKAKLVQKYFTTMENRCGDENKIYFERRQNEYSKNMYQASKIFDLRTIVQAYNAMILGEPFNSSRYVKKIFESKELFKSDDEESYYYVATLCFYKLNVMINSKKFKYSILKWHFLYLFKFLAVKQMKGFERNGSKASKISDKLIEVLTDKNKFEKVVEDFYTIVEKIPLPSTDTLKRQKYAIELFDETKKLIEKK